MNHHPLLGELSIHQSTGATKASIPYSERCIELLISGDEEPYGRALEEAAALVKRLSELDALAKAVASRELTKTYNNDWNEYQQSQ